MPLAGPEVAELQKQQPYYASVPLPANTYKGQTAAVPTLAVMAVWATHEALPEAVAYEVTKALYENTAIMGQVHAQERTSAFPRRWRWAPCRCTRARRATSARRAC
ncbi:MAG: TAXI family TRAP transporter solute-binding subunit [Rubrivivax sp.]